MGVFGISFITPVILIGNLLLPKAIVSLIALEASPNILMARLSVMTMVPGFIKAVSPFPCKKG